MNSSEDPTGEREFLHDLSNIIAIVQGNMHLLMRKIQKDPAAIKIDEIMPKLESSMTAVNRMVGFLNARREKVRNDQAATQKDAS